jgi:hypothetical protein
MEPATACQTDPSALLANDCASFIIACTISKDDPANKEMRTRQTKTRLSQKPAKLPPQAEKLTSWPTTASQTQRSRGGKTGSCDGLY